MTVSGGTLTLVGAGDVDHLDPALAYHTVTRGILRAYTRQLVGYAASRDRDTAGRIEADMATEVPTEANGRLTDNATRYRFTIRDGVCWHTPTGPRQVTAQDVVRGIKRLVHPRHPSPGRSYYLSTIAGLTEFRDTLAAGPQTLAGIADRLEHTEISGVRALDDREISFTTVTPASDFLNILAVPFATPAPIEYLAAEHPVIMSNGPYRIAEYVPGQRIRLDRNPAWKSDTDPVRAAHLDAIDIREGVAEDVAYELVAAGAADMLWDIQPITARVPNLLARNDPRLEVYPAGLLSPYLAINMRSPNADHATAKHAVRVALQYAVDKAAVSPVWGGPRLNDIADGVLPVLCTAYQNIHPYGTPDGRGDPDKARELLTQAGYPDGLTLKLVHRNRDIHPDTAYAIRDGMARAGITLELVPVSINELFDDYFGSGVGDWDLAITGWEPDWYGNNARTYLQPLFDSRAVADNGNGDWGANYGRYRNPRVNRLLDEALACADERRAGALFREVEAEVLRDAAIVPILFAHQYWFHSPRVRNWLPYPVLNGDLTNLWVEG